MALLLPQVRLGNTGLSVAPLALGTVKLGRNKDVKYPTPVKIPKDDEARDLLRAAQSLGINLIDTAPAYGNSETRVGQLLKGQRQDWVICTKVGEDWGDEGSAFNFTPEHVAFSVNRSLERLATDFIDIVLIHSDGNDIDIVERYGTLDALQELKQSGKVGSIGISHKTPEGGKAAIAAGADVIMATLNKDYTDEAALIADAATQGVGVLIKKAMRSGHGDITDLAWVHKHTGVHSIVVGTANPAHLQANAAVLLAD